MVRLLIFNSSGPYTTMVMSKSRVAPPKKVNIATTRTDGSCRRGKTSILLTQPAQDNTHRVLVGQSDSYPLALLYQRTKTVCQKSRQ